MSIFLAALLLAPTGAGSAGTSYLTATPIDATRPAQVSAVTGDYLYWSFPATAGQQPDLNAKVTLPPVADRHGYQAWTIEVFDGLRRRQPCVAGEQSPIVTNDATEVALGCRLRQVRSWAEPSDQDPLPGTYYVRLSSTALPEQDLGLPVKVDLTLTAEKGDTGADQGKLAAPLNPVNRPGTVTTDTPTPAPSASAAAGDSSWASDLVPEFSSRWVWTAGGGILAAIAGLVGFSFTRRRARRP
ncbi:peptidase [Actinoplanes sp. NPDC000266]